MFTFSKWQLIITCSKVLNIIEVQRFVEQRGYLSRDQLNQYQLYTVS